MAAKPELVYFDGRGRGEIIRLVLTAAGIEFTEQHLTTREQFLALQPELLFLQVPLLRIDGHSLVQTSAIVQHVARRGNLLGQKEPEITKISILYEGSRDFMGVFLAIGFAQDETKMEERRPTVVKYLTIFNKVLKDNDTGYFVGSSLTLADLGILETILPTIEYFGGKDILNNYPELLKWYNTVTSLERIAKYIKEIRKPRNNAEYVGVVKRVLNP